MNLKSTGLLITAMIMVSSCKKNNSTDIVELKNQEIECSQNTCIVSNYNENGVLISSGKVRRENRNFRINKWRFIKLQYDSIVEYLDVNNRSYVNQFWIINRHKDTLFEKSNFFEYNFKDSINVNQPARVQFYLNSKFYNSSDVEVILPYDTDKLNDDFSNISKIRTDTFPSLDNEGIPHPEISEEVPTDRLVDFNLIYETPENKKIKGALVEYYYNKDSTRIERRLYFEKFIYVKPKE